MLLYCTVHIERKALQMKTLFGLCAAAFVASTLVFSAQAATPEQVNTLMKTLVPGTFAGVEDVTVIGRNLTVSFFPEGLKNVKFIAAADLEKPDTMVLGLHMPMSEGGCAHIIIDVGLTGAASEWGKVCEWSDAEMADPAFFDQFGGAQALYDKIIAEALK